MYRHSAFKPNCPQGIRHKQFEKRNLAEQAFTLGKDHADWSVVIVVDVLIVARHLYANLCCRLSGPCFPPTLELICGSRPMALFMISLTAIQGN